LKGVNQLKDYSGDMKIFIPTLHKNNVSFSNLNKNIIFGSIDYDAQVLALLNKANSDIAAFSDGSMLSSNLNSRVLEQNANTRFYRV
ncbi:hypothetical protein LZB66_08510, partial [Campylobacter lari]|nr:hypothetical protein [Campylobacter lari]